MRWDWDGPVRIRRGDTCEAAVLEVWERPAFFPGGIPDVKTLKSDENKMTARSELSQ